MKTLLYFIILLGVVIYITSCSRHFYPAPDFNNVDSQVDKEGLNNFMAEGTGKEIDLHTLSADVLIKSAEEYLGVPHCMGGSSKKCMDCSGLLVAVFEKHNIYLPHNSEEQARFGKIIADVDRLKKGDLVFFIKTYNTNKFITHSGIYLGNNEFIHTSSSQGVSITSLTSSYWKDKFIFGTRLFSE